MKEEEHKHNLIESITFRKKFYKYYKVYTIFCLSCDYKKEIEIRICKDDYVSSFEIRLLREQNTTNKTYNQNINNIKK